MNNQCEILLVGQPNVGKSVLFSRITGLHTISSNYHGTTVTYTAGTMQLGEEKFQIIDAPGTYSLEPIDDAGKVATELVYSAKRIINVIDATHLERNLPLTLELLAQERPMVVALNMSDEARHRGISIDTGKLAEILGVPVIATVARTGEGIKELVEAIIKLPEARIDHHINIKNIPHIKSQQQHKGCQKKCNNCQGHIHLSGADSWAKIGEIVAKVQTLSHHHHTFIEMLEDISLHPIAGAFIALIVMAISFAFIRLIGEFLITGEIGLFNHTWITIPFGTELFFDSLIKPLLTALSSFLGDGSVLQRILIGNTINGEIDFLQSFGVLTSGLFVPLGAVFPYIFSFYLVMSILEDSGYLPRLAVFLDNIMHRFGLHGYAIIPILLGSGCNVPGILATRILETRSQRFITATLISIAVPCVALQAMIVNMVGSRGVLPLLCVFGILIIVWILIGLTLKLISNTNQPELLIEIPPYRLPEFKMLMQKIWPRIKDFFKEAMPIVMGAILVVNILYQINIFDQMATFFAPLITKIWGMPKESIVPLFIGILRKDVALGMFLPLNLTTKQLITGSVILSMFFPCLATMVVMIKELGIKDSIKSMLVMFISVILTGWLINIFLPATFFN